MMAITSLSFLFSSRYNVRIRAFSASHSASEEAHLVALENGAGTLVITASLSIVARFNGQLQAVKDNMLEVMVGQPSRGVLILSR